MTNKKKRFLITTCAIALSLTISVTANAGTVTTKVTSGGTAGKITIRSEISSNESNPATNVYMAAYSVTSNIPAESTLVTTFNIQAKVSRSDGSRSFSKSGTANSVTASLSTSGVVRDFYDYLYSSTDTTSSAFGISSQECNGPV